MSVKPTENNEKVLWVDVHDQHSNYLTIVEATLALMNLKKTIIDGVPALRQQLPKLATAATVLKESTQRISALDIKSLPEATQEVAMDDFAKYFEIFSSISDEIETLSLISKELELLGVSNAATTN